MTGDLWVLKGSGQVLENVHPEGQCVGVFCAIHNPAPGPWDDWDMVFSYQGMFRICEHGVRHNAVEDILVGLSWGFHGCDGCPCGVEHIDWERGDSGAEA